MPISRGEAEYVLHRFGARRYFEVESAIKPFRFRGFGPRLLLAIGVRESNLLQVNNETGTDRGVFQINRTYHDEFLGSVPGCKTTEYGDWAPSEWEYKLSFRPVDTTTALDDGYTPPLADAAEYAYLILHGAYTEAARLGLRGGAQLRFTIASYNTGIGGATKGLDEGDVDKYTTHGDYSADVLFNIWRDQVNPILDEWGWH